MFCLLRFLSAVFMICFVYRDGFGNVEGQVAYLLISQNTEELNSGGSYYFAKQDESKLEELIRIFKTRMEPVGLKTVVITEAKAQDLKFVLSNPLTHAVFWVGHASQTHSGMGFNFNGIVVDSKGVNVAPLFKNIHPNVRWVSIVGCNTKNMIDMYKNQGFYRWNPALIINGSDGYAIASKDLVYSAGQAALSLPTLLSRYPGLICDREPDSFRTQGLYLRIQRKTTTESNPETVVFNSGEFTIGYMTSEEDEIEVWVPFYIPLELIEVVGVGLDNLDTGEFIITNRSEKLNWQIFTNKDGKVIAAASRKIYLLNSPREDLRVYSETKASNCF